MKDISDEQDEEGDKEDEITTYKDEETINEERTTEEPGEVKIEQNRKTERSIARPRQKAVTNNEGRVNCDDCDSTFTTTGSLNLHIKTKHEGERFTCMSSLTAHTNSKHAGIRYPCTECEHQATQQSHLNVHTNSKHAGIRCIPVLSVLVDHLSPKKVI